MSEPYIKLSDQDKDWTLVIKNFIADAALQDLIEIKKHKPLIQRRHEYDRNNNIVKKETYGAPETHIVLSEDAKTLGYTDVRVLFNQWFNKTHIFFDKYKRSYNGQ